MIYYVFALKDKAAGYFNVPQLAKHDGEHETESLARAVSQLKGFEARKAMDCALYELGTFDDNTGKFNLYDEAVKLCECADFVKVEVTEDGKENQ